MANIITNCTFKGPDVIWDGDASKAILYTAKGLYNLTKLFESQNITISPLLVIGEDGNGKEEKS